MKSAEAAEFYDDLAQQVAGDVISDKTMIQGCKALIEIGKVANLPIPGFVKCNHGNLYYTWNNGDHSLEISIPMVWAASLVYRNSHTKEYLFSVWRIGEDPVPTRIADKLKFFADN